MDTWSTNREVEKPKRTKAELRTILHLEARSHANECEQRADNIALMLGTQDAPAIATLRKAAKFLRLLSEPEPF